MQKGVCLTGAVSFVFTAPFFVLQLCKRDFRAVIASPAGEKTDAAISTCGATEALVHGLRIGSLPRTQGKPGEAEQGGHFNLMRRERCRMGRLSLSPGRFRAGPLAVHLRLLADRVIAARRLCGSRGPLLRRGLRSRWGRGGSWIFCIRRLRAGTQTAHRTFVLLPRPCVRR